jgi:hypothetical protein
MPGLRVSVMAFAPAASSSTSPSVILAGSCWALLAGRLQRLPQRFPQPLDRDPVIDLMLAQVSRNPFVCNI